MIATSRKTTEEITNHLWDALLLGCSGAGTG